MSRAVHFRNDAVKAAAEYKPAAPVATPSTSQWASYQALYDYLNAQLFGGQLPACVLNFSRHSRCVGFFAPATWKSSTENKTVCEISINPDHLTRRELRATVSTLAHEMVHLWQHAFGTPSRAGYHNAEWATEMERIGLIPSSTGEPGGKKVGQSMTHYIRPLGPFDVAFKAVPPEALLPWRAAPLSADEKARRATKRASKTRYLCRSCECKAWGAPGLQLRCVPCDNVMITDEENAED